MIGILQRGVSSHFDMLIGLNALNRWLLGKPLPVTEEEIHKTVSCTNLHFYRQTYILQTDRLKRLRY